MNPKARILSLLTVALFLALPGSAVANVQITEIMYDLKGNDSGREWIEITNTGSGPVDISQYRFFEGDTNHKLTSHMGSTVLQPGSSAIIADNAEKFKADWPSYTGALFDSAFSLSNNGESIAIKNASLAIEDSTSYTSALGGKGDSGSLQRTGESYVSGLPTPGLFGGEIKPVPRPAPSPSAQKSTRASSTKQLEKTTSRTSTPQANENSETDFSLYFYLLGVAAIAGIGVAGSVYARSSRRGYAETKSIADEFEILE